MSYSFNIEVTEDGIQIPKQPDDVAHIPKGVYTISGHWDRGDAGESGDGVNIYAPNMSASASNRSNRHSVIAAYEANKDEQPS